MVIVKVKKKNFTNLLKNCSLYRFILLITFAFFYQISFGQEKSEDKSYYGRVYGGLESNSQFYLDDSGLGVVQPDEPFRSNNYINVNYNFKKWTGGLQVESYEPNALLNYNPQFKGTDLATYYLKYKTEKWNITLGHFYEQFGSGLLLRAWEDRSLGINSALRGARIHYTPNSNYDFTLLYGRQRSGFSVTDGDIYGFNADVFLGEQLNLYEKNQDLSLGFSYVGRYESVDFENPNFNELTNSYSFRFDYLYNSFYINGEANYKSEDGLLNVQNELSNQFVKPGSAYQVNFGYSQLNLGVDVTLRRLENMGFFSEREPSIFVNSLGEVQTSFDYLDKFLNYVPALTKQHHSQLANIYVFQAQNSVLFEDSEIMRAGETGGQIDFFYTFEKGTDLGGKYGTQVSINLSSWYNLPGTYTFNPPDYDVDFFGIGNKYFHDYNIELKKKLNESWHIGANYINQYYDQRFLGGGKLVKTDIFTSEATYNFTKEKSLRLELEKMFADADRKDWVGGTAEFNLNKEFSFYVWDIYNYGNDDPSRQVHYLNVGGSYRKSAFSLTLNYGRQRGGLVCVGGVCRFVPESTGFSLSFNTSF